jgi:hypothetical protein
MMLLSGFVGLGYFAYRGMAVFIFLRCVGRYRPLAAASVGDSRGSFRRKSGHRTLIESRQLATLFGRALMLITCDRRSRANPGPNFAQPLARSVLSGWFLSSQQTD